MEEKQDITEIPPEKEDSVPVLKSGNCYHFATSNLKKWYDRFESYYYSNVKEDDNNEKVKWDDRQTSTLIKYSRGDRNLSITITLHNNTGTVMIQGSTKSLSIWIDEHYPELKNLQVSKSDNDLTEKPLKQTTASEDSPKVGNEEQGEGTHTTSNNEQKTTDYQTELNGQTENNSLTNHETKDLSNNQPADPTMPSSSNDENSVSPPLRKTEEGDLMTEHANPEPVLSPSPETTQQINEDFLPEEEEVDDIDDFLDNTVIQIPLLNSTLTEGNTEETFSSTLDEGDTVLISSDKRDYIGSPKNHETHSGTIDMEGDSDIIISPNMLAQQPPKEVLDISPELPKQTNIKVKEEETPSSAVGKQIVEPMNVEARTSIIVEPSKMQAFTDEGKKEIVEPPNASNQASTKFSEQQIIHRMSNVETTCENTEKELLRVFNLMETNILKLQNFTEDLEKKNGSLEAKFKEQVKENKLLNEKVTTLTNQIETLQTKLQEKMLPVTESQENLKSSFEELEKKNTLLETKSQELEKENNLLQQEITGLTEKHNAQEQKIEAITQKGEQVEYKKAPDDYQAIINKQASKIQLLEAQLEAKDTLTFVKESFDEKVKDLEIRISSKRKEEKTEKQTFIDDTNREIKEIKDMLKRKAPQSEMDKLAQKINDIPPFPGSPPVPPPLMSLLPDKKSSLMNRCHAEQEQGHQYHNEDQGERRSLNSDEENHLKDSEKNLYQGQAAVLIMDSNMNFIKERQFWSDTFKLKCGRAELLENKLKQFNLSKAEHIIIGTGTNDIEKGLTASSIFTNLLNAALKLSEIYNDSHVYLAQLPPMVGKEVVVEELNDMIKNNTPENIHTILHENISLADLHDTKHIQIKKLGKLVRNMKNKIRTVIDDERSTSNNNNFKPNKEHSIDDNKATQPASARLSYNKQNNKDNNMEFMNNLMKEFQLANQRMLLEMKNSIISSLS